MSASPTHTTINLSWQKALGLLLAAVSGLVCVVSLPIIAIAALGFWSTVFYCIVLLFVLMAGALLASAFKERSREEARLACILLGIAGSLIVLFVGLTSSATEFSATELSPQSSGRDWASASRRERREVCEVMSTRMRLVGSDVTASFLHQALTEYFDGAGSQDSIASAAGLCAALAGH